MCDFEIDPDAADAFLPDYMLRDKTYCPCMILTIAGPWLCVAGAVYTTAPIVQVLSVEWAGQISLPGNAPPSPLERMFYSLKTAISLLEGYYSALSETQAAVNGFPYISTYNGICFDYIEKLGGEDLGMQVYKVKEVGGPFRVVKFTRTYSDEAHRLLSKEDCAPNLQHVSPCTFGGLRMIVMDFVNGKPASEEKLLHPHIRQLEKALKLLHDNGFVFWRSSEAKYHNRERRKRETR